MNRTWLFAGVGALIAAALSLWLAFGNTHHDTMAVTESPAAAPPDRPADNAAPSGAAQKDAPRLALRFIDVRTGKPRGENEACLTFDEALSSETDYAPFIEVRRLSPKGEASGAPIKPALRVSGDELCVGALEHGFDYRIVMGQGLPAASGATLSAGAEARVVLPDLPSRVRFTGNGFIVPRRDQGGVPLETVNASKLKIQVYRLGDRGLVPEFRQYWSNRSLEYYAVNDIVRNRGTLIWSGDMAVEGPRNKVTTTLFPLQDVMPQRRPGAYLVVAQIPSAATLPMAEQTDADEDGDSDAGENGWQLSRNGRFTAQWIVDSDIALSTIRGNDGLHVVARSLSTAKPLSGVEIALLSQGNDELAKIRTDAKGEAAFEQSLMRGRGGALPVAVMAFGPDQDFALQQLERPSLDLADQGVSGRPYPTVYDAYLYADRGVYRPGETVRLVAMLRDRNAIAVEGQRATLVIRRPSGAEARRLTLEAAGPGLYETAIELPRGAARGIWSVQFHLDPTAEPISRLDFDVQDFVPQKLRVEANSTTEQITADKPLSVSIQADFLYGAPAAELPVEASVNLEVDRTPFENLKRFRFDQAGDTPAPVIEQLDAATTDGKGHAEVTWSLDGKRPLAGQPIKARLIAGVAEPGGRVTKTELVRPVRDLPAYIGVRPTFSDDRIGYQQDATFEVIAVDGQGVAMERAVLVDLYEEIWDYQFYRVDNRWQYNATVRDKLLETRRVPVAKDRPANVTFRKLDWGRYRVAVSDANGAHKASARFRAGWVQTSETEAPDRVEVTVEKPTYRTGETARVAIKGPTGGIATVHVATDRILHSQVVQVPPGGTRISLPVTEAWGPGAYVLVSLVRPLSAGGPREPVRSVGTAWIGRDTSERRLSVKVDAPQRIQSRGKLDVAVSVGPERGSEPVFVTLAAVDEGILQITRFASPKPDDHFLGRRALGVELRDSYTQLLLADGRVGRLRSGGDEMGGSGLAVVPTRIVALFSGLVRTDANGVAKVSFDVPDFNGELRLMAVAQTRSRMGQAEARVTVRDPVVAELSLPRFLAPGDSAELTFSIHNVDGVRGDYAVTVGAADAVSIGGNGKASFSLNTGDRRTQSFTLKAANAIGTGNVRLAVTGPNGLRLEREWPIAVRGSSYPLTVARYTVLKPGESSRVRGSDLNAFIPGSARVSLSFSSLEGFDIAGLLQSLDLYPYGCSEQITSRAMPLLAFADPNLLGPEQGKTADGVKRRVQEAIDTLLERQSSDGGFGLWRADDGYASQYLVLYVIDFLSEARRRGYKVPDSALLMARQWISRSTRNLRFDGSNRRDADAFQTAAYANYLLSREWQPEIGDLRYLADRSASQSNDPLALAQLGAALALAGESARAHTVLARAETQISQGYSYDYYRSTLRDTAAVLALALEAKDMPVAERARLRVIADVIQPDELNTQEKTWLLRAASRLGMDRPQIAVNGTALGATRGPAVALAPTTADIKAGYEVRNVGTRPTWQNLTVRGVPARAPEASANNYTLEKKFVSLTGQPIDPQKLHQNDRLIVVLSGALTAEGRRQAVLVDMLPAGWEIESVITPNAAETYKLDKLSRAQTQEARDDRYVAAIEVGENRNSYYRENENGREFRLAYLVRAITPGAYAQPAAVVEDMYRPANYARTAAGRVSVQARP